MTNENMIQAVNAAREIFESLIVAQSPLTPFSSKDNARTLAAEFCRALGDLVDECGGDRSQFPGVEDGLFDAIDDGFEQAIRDYDDEQEALADPTEREMSRADRVYDATRV